MGAASVSQATAQLSKPVGPPSTAASHGQRTGRFHEVAGLTSDGGFRLVTMSTYTGMSTLTTKRIYSTYLVVRPRRRRAFFGPAGAATGTDVVRPVETLIVPS